MDILHIAGATLTFFFLVLLLSKPGRSVADAILAGWFGVILSGIAASYIVSKAVPGKWLFLELSETISFLHGPFLWFYTLALTRQLFRFRRADLLHLTPFLLSLPFFLIPVWLNEPIPESRRDYSILVKLLLILGYALASLRQLRRYEQALPEFLSNTEKYRLRWLGILIGGILVIWCIGAVSLSLYRIGGWAIPDYGGWYTNAAVSLFILVLGYFGFRHTPIFVPPHFAHSGTPTATGSPTPEPAKYSKSGLDEATGRAYYEQLNAYMARHEPYLDSQLTLFQLAEALRVSPNHLSQVINTFYRQNFFDFVNAYRVAAVKKKIEAGAHRQHTLLALALDCGFYSKASFNRAFRKFAGVTPSEYVKQVEGL